MSSQPYIGKMTVQVNRSATQVQRTATLDIRYTTIAIAPPQNRPKTQLLSPVTLQAILVTETDPAPECEPTNLQDATLDDSLPLRYRGLATASQSPICNLQSAICNLHSPLPGRCN